MNKRERILAAVIGLLAIGFGGQWLYGRYHRSLEVNQAQLGTAQEQLALAKHAINRGERAVRSMEEWRSRSLPSNRDKALSLYKAWLLATAKDAGLKVDDIQPARSTPSAAFTAIGYQIQATGSLPSVVKLMYEFYRSPQLQQITRLRLTRPVGATELEVEFEAEALVLPGADATDALPTGESKRLQLASLDEYQKSLGDRDLASAYKPPRPPREVTKRDTPPPPPKFDEAELAFFSAAVSDGNGMQAWIHVRTTGETLHLAVGDPVKVGSLEGEIVAVEPRSLVLQTGEKKFRVALGQSIRKGAELDADGKPTVDTKPESPES